MIWRRLSVIFIIWKRKLRITFYFVLGWLVCMITVKLSSIVVFRMVIQLHIWAVHYLFENFNCRKSFLWVLQARNSSCLCIRGRLSDRGCWLGTIVNWIREITKSTTSNCKFRWSLSLGDGKRKFGCCSYNGSFSSFPMKCWLLLSFSLSSSSRTYPERLIS